MKCEDSSNRVVIRVHNLLNLCFKVRKKRQQNAVSLNHNGNLKMSKWQILPIINQLSVDSPTALAHKTTEMVSLRWSVKIKMVEELIKDVAVSLAGLV